MLRIWPFILFAAILSAVQVRAQETPDGDFFGPVPISPAVELVLAGANGVLAGYNALLLYENRRRQFAAGAAVITGTIGIILGTRDGANYPVADLILGGAALVAGGANLLIMRAPRMPLPPSFQVTAALVRSPEGDVVPGLVARVAARRR